MQAGGIPKEYTHCLVANLEFRPISSDGQGRRGLRSGLGQTGSNNRLLFFHGPFLGVGAMVILCDGEVNEVFK